MRLRNRLSLLFSGKKTEGKEIASTTILINKMREQKRRSLAEIKDNKQAITGIVWRAGYTNEVEMQLFAKQDCPKSQYMLALMNYSELGFKKISDMYLLDYAQYEFEELKALPEAERFPVLRSRYRLNPQELMVGEEDILNWLIENDMLKFFDMMAPEMPVVLDFIDKQIKRPLEILFWNPALSAECSWEGDIRSFFRADRSYALLGVLRMNIQKVLRQWRKNFPQMYRNKEEYRQSKTQFQKGVKEFCRLIEGKRYAGGEEPNHIDFYLYAIIKTKDNSRTFRRYLEEKVSKQFLGWYRLMNSTCQYHPDRVTLKRVE